LKDALDLDEQVEPEARGPLFVEGDRLVPLGEGLGVEIDYHPSR
jgi:hypothetical protein